MHLSVWHILRSVSDYVCKQQQLCWVIRKKVSTVEKPFLHANRFLQFTAL